MTDHPLRDGIRQDYLRSGVVKKSPLLKRDKPRGVKGFKLTVHEETRPTDSGETAFEVVVRRGNGYVGAIAFVIPEGGYSNGGARLGFDSPIYFRSGIKPEGSSHKAYRELMIADLRKIVPDCPTV